MDYVNIPPGTDPEQGMRLLEAAVNRLADEVTRQGVGRWTREDVNRLGREVMHEVTQSLQRSITRERPWRP